jgi:transcriptional repressor NrdR
VADPGGRSRRRVAGLPLGTFANRCEAVSMRCPFCGSDDNQVKDSRPVEEGGSVRRRRQCNACGARFTTFERIQLRELTVIKRDGKRVPFDRDKVKRSITIATRKRGIDEERIDRIVNGMVREIELSGETEIEASRLGALAMKRLAELDEVAYVRFASVYHDFTGVRDFERFIARMAAESERASAEADADVAAG